MQKLVLNTGVEEYEVEDNTGKVLGVLRVNSSDPNLYARFMDLYNELPNLLEKYQELDVEEKVELDKSGFPAGNEEKAKQILPLYRNVDKEVKEKLEIVFDAGNDFEVLFGGMNILAGTDTGKSVLENFLETLLPLVEASMTERDKKTKEKAQEAVTKANLNREQRRALAKE